MQEMQMVPGAGPFSNRQNPLLAEWERHCKGDFEGAASPPGGADIERLFDTLAEWNEYLERHVPAFGEGQAPQEPGL